MKIDGFQAGKLYEAYASSSGKPANTNTGSAAADDGMDRVEISEKASQASKASELRQQATSSETAEQRQQRIDEIKKLVNEGQYHVPARAVAQSMLIGRNLDIKA